MSALVPSEDAMLEEQLDAALGEYDGDIVVEPENTEGEPWEGIFDRVFLLDGKVEVPRTWRASRTKPERSAYPMLVTFGDLGDPTSVARVDPDDLAASFGEGVSLKRVTVELTDDPVTKGIEERLPTPDDRGFYAMRTLVDGQERSVRLGRSAFSKGVQ